MEHLDLNDPIFKKQSLRAAAKVLDEHNARFGHHFKSFQQEYAKLPKRTASSDENNSLFDSDRVKLIIKCLFYIRVYTIENKKTLSTCQDPEQKGHLEALMLTYQRQLFITVSQLIFNTSGKFRGTYKHLLSPAPFSWETFEHFGAAMMDHSHIPERHFIETDNLFKTITVRDESFHKESIIEAAVQMIINVDLDDLIDFFKMIQADLDKTTPAVELKQYQFLAIKAITKRVMDVATLMKLFNQTTNNRLTPDEVKSLNLKSKTKGQYNTSLIMYGHTSQRPYAQLNSKMMIHAALRRLEMIGELLSGKYFSSEWKNLDETIDWNAFATLRDGIAHQDVGDNHVKVQNLIQDKTLLTKIIQEDLPSFHERLQKLCYEKSLTEPAFKINEAAQFCGDLFTKEIHLLQEAMAQNNTPTPPDTKVKLSKEERLKARQERENAAEARKRAITDKFVGLDSIRAVAASFSFPKKEEDTLSNQKRREIALQHLKDIEEFFKSTSGLTIKKLTDHALIYKALENDTFLNDAVNYNVEQFLQHLESIKTDPVLQENELIKNGFDALRYLRNHVAHGALLLDTEQFTPGAEKVVKSTQQHHVAIGLKTLLVEFIPLLEKSIDQANKASGVRIKP